MPAVATPIPMDTTVLAQNVSVIDGHEITMATEGVYSIAFSSQLRNAAAQRRDVTIWLSKNGISPQHWMPETTTDITLGTTLEDERNVAAWNFFVDARAGDYFVLMIVASGSNVLLDGGVSRNTVPEGIPVIPSTILTVNQVG